MWLRSQRHGYSQTKFQPSNSTMNTPAPNQPNLSPTTAALALVPLGVLLNLGIGTIVHLLKLPLFVDAVGTILVTLLIGWRWGSRNRRSLFPCRWYLDQSGAALVLRHSSGHRHRGWRDGVKRLVSLDSEDNCYRSHYWHRSCNCERPSHYLSLRRDHWIRIRLYHFVPLGFR